MLARPFLGSSNNPIPLLESVFFSCGQNLLNLFATLTYEHINSLI